MGIVGPNPEIVAQFLEFGFTWVAIGSDIGMMVGRAQEWLAKVRGDGATAPSSPPAAY